MMSIFKAHTWDNTGLETSWKLFQAFLLPPEHPKLVFGFSFCNTGCQGTLAYFFDQAFS